MKKNLYLCMLIVFATVATISYCGCAHKKQKKESIYPEGKLYHQPYDKVWDAVHSLIFTDLGCVEKVVNKKEGYIETEWAASLTDEGTLQWRIIAQVKQKNDGTLVLFDKDIEQSDIVKPNKSNFKEQSKDQNEWTATDWRRSKEKSSAADNLYEHLDNNLK